MPALQHSVPVVGVSTQCRCAGSCPSWARRVVRMHNELLTTPVLLLKELLVAQLRGHACQPPRLSRPQALNPAASKRAYANSHCVSIPMLECGLP
jgi:hypothetical protein